ncbi:MAG: ABC transporter substrate-binding protein [Ardenticatenaceae bacterium]
MQKKHISKMMVRMMVMMTFAFSLLACNTTESEVESSNSGSSTEVASVEVESTPSPANKFKILHVTSYHADWQWSQDQYQGFQDAFEGLDIEFNLFEMDTKRRGAEEWEAIGQQAQEVVEEWQPDLVYTSDDNAQKYVVSSYLGSDTPFVFSGVNAAPETYGFVESGNVTGVLEQEHFVQTVQLLKEVVPEVKKIALVFDEDPMWSPVQKRLESLQNDLPTDVEIVSWDVIQTFDQYQEKMLEYQSTVDAVGLVGVFQFKDENGQNVGYQDVLKWTAENSDLPDFSFWKSRAQAGTLVVVSVSGYEQGLAAGQQARGILVEGKSPADYPMEPTLKGELVISLARANKLGLKIDSGILLTAEVLPEFEWETSPN